MACGGGHRPRGYGFGAGCARERRSTDCQKRPRCCSGRFLPTRNSRRRRASHAMPSSRGTPCAMGVSLGTEANRF